MKRFPSVSKGLVVSSLLALGSISAFADDVTMPEADYANINAAATVGFAVILTVGLLMKAKRFFS